MGGHYEMIVWDKNDDIIHQSRYHFSTQARKAFYQMVKILQKCQNYTNILESNNGKPKS